MTWLPARDRSTHPALCAGNLCIRTRYLPADAGAGGDLYDVADTPFGLRLLVGDVMGTGQLANQTGVVVRNAWKAIAATEPTLAGIAVRLHGLITRSAHPERFVTAFLANFGAGPRTEFVCCGHPPPLLLRGTTATFVDPCPPAPPLGLLDLSGGWCTPGTFRLTPGEHLLLYTDGVCEARDSGGAFFALGEHAVRALAAGGGDGDALLDTLVSSLGDHRLDAGARAPAADDPDAREQGTRGRGRHEQGRHDARTGGAGTRARDARARDDASTLGARRARRAQGAYAARGNAGTRGAGTGTRDAGAGTRGAGAGTRDDADAGTADDVLLLLVSCEA